MTVFPYLLIVITLLGPASGDTGDDLREAVSNGNADRVKFLLESGANANTSYENGFTPIYFADSPKIVDLLIAHGARLSIRDRASLQSPIEDVAEEYDRFPEARDTLKIILAKLRDAGAEYTIDTAIYMNEVEVVEKRLAADASWVNKRRGAATRPVARRGTDRLCRDLQVAPGAQGRTQRVRGGQRISDHGRCSEASCGRETLDRTWG